MTIPSLRRILLVEDDADIRTVARLALESAGEFEVAVAVSGQEALEKAPVFAPDLILLDVMMPGLDGIETLHELRRQPESAATPVIFLTAKVQPAEIAQYFRQGVLDVIVKPFDAMTLGDQVTAIWRQRATVEGAPGEDPAG